MTEYLRNPAMADNTKSFRCYNCGKLLVKHIQGNYELKLDCPRCKTSIDVRCKEAIPIAMEHK